MQLAGRARRYFRRAPFRSFPGPLRQQVPYLKLGAAEGKAETRPGASCATQIGFLAAETQLVNCLFLVVIYPAGRAGKASAGVPLLWPGTDVLLDPGDEHGGIVPLGTDGDAPAAMVMPFDF
jgi:hypothetical protein